MARIIYSLDLRERVIDHIKGGNNQRTTSKLFKVSTSTVSLWWIRYQKEGHVRPRKLLGSKGKIDTEILIKMIEEDGDKTLAEMGLICKVSASAISQKLRRLGYSYKKKRLPMWKLMKRSEINI
jgi:transposase